MQATVKQWDPVTHDGSVLFDDGRELAFPGQAVQVRALRPGQRVRLRLAGGQVIGVTLATLPFS